ncbi:antibiotic biosynthesis monooxygenase family protein [Pseudodesulfovibrio cashew]|uniref:antibiotic biosynthesis monooxygenase family protein n=1 Tax=Pseudodesulfovibrio cashew TaxID=2678688 RepID=UPI001F554300|nr:antibiotic biosynthesis monooxygenase [Pseudodesulfovibrio cashew]
MNTPLKTPCYAVIFTSKRTDVNEGYAETGSRMLELAKTMPGFLGADSAREEVGITVSYWESLEAIKAWREHPGHGEAQRLGREKWYEWFTTRICRVEKESQFPD